MPLRGVLFDLYGTLIDIETDESAIETYDAVALYLMYQGIYIDAGEVRDRYWRTAGTLARESREPYPEVDVEVVWNTLLAGEGMKAGSARRRLARTLAQLLRALSRRRFRLFTGATELLDGLRGSMRLAIVSDAQVCYALPEMAALGLDGYFDAVVISALYGFRKPDGRLFEKALSSLGLGSKDVVHVGNDIPRDVVGAHRSGIRAILVHGSATPGEDLREAPDYVAADLAGVRRGVDALSAASVG